MFAIRLILEDDMNTKQKTEDDFEQMRQYFEKFVHEIENLCRSSIINEVWFTSNDVCRLLKIDKSTLLRYRTTGVIPHSRIMNKYYYKRSDIEELVAKSYIKQKNHKHG